MRTMTFDIEIVLRDRDTAIAQRLEHDGNDAAEWTELDVHDVLKSMLLAIDRARELLGYAPSHTWLAATGDA